MEGIAILGGIKMLIDIFESNWTGVATGILMSGVPGSDLITLGSSAAYLFDLNGNLIGEKSLAGLKQYSTSSFKLENESEVRRGYQLIMENNSFSKRSGGSGFSRS